MRFWLVLAALATPAMGQGLAPETSLKPVQSRPDTSLSTKANDKSTAPKTGPENARSGEGNPKPPVALVPGIRDKLRLGADDYDACLSKLDAMGVVYEPASPIIPPSDADCGIHRPLLVTHIAADVAITPAATLRCPAVLALAVWTRDFVIPASKRIKDRGALTAIENGSGYVCRRRNNLPDGKLSEHAFGNAFDVMGFRFADGPPLPIEPREAQGTMAESFQDAVRASACLDFSTVLGPGSNASHADHLHLDVIARTSGYRLCEQGGAAPD